MSRPPRFPNQFTAPLNDPERPRRRIEHRGEWISPVSDYSPILGSPRARTRDYAGSPRGYSPATYSPDPASAGPRTSTPRTTTYSPDPRSPEERTGTPRSLRGTPTTPVTPDRPLFNEKWMVNNNNSPGWREVNTFSYVSFPYF